MEIFLSFGTVGPLHTSQLFTDDRDFGVGQFRVLDLHLGVVSAAQHVCSSLSLQGKHSSTALASLPNGSIRQEAGSALPTASDVKGQGSRGHTSSPYQPHGRGVSETALPPPPPQTTRGRLTTPQTPNPKTHKQHPHTHYTHYQGQLYSAAQVSCRAHSPKCYGG